MSNALSFFADGSVYERLMGRWSQKAGTVFLDWLAPNPGLRWLDAGCGNGAFTEALVRHAAPAAVTGIDPSEGQIAAARARSGAAMAEFQVGDAQALPFPDRSFDAAAMALVVSFIPDPPRAAAELARVVRPGGVVATYMWDAGKGSSPVGPMMRAVKAVGSEFMQPPGAAFSTREGLESLWRGAGFSEVESREIRIPVTFESVEDYWASNAVPAGPSGLLLAAMSDIDRDRVRARLSQELPVGPSGSVEFEAIANAVKGRVRD